jgi:hypothetical protein
VRACRVTKYKLDSLISDQIELKENGMEERKVLSLEEIESQTLMELPDRPLLGDPIVVIVTNFLVLIFNLGGGGGGGGGGNE